MSDSPKAVNPALAKAMATAQAAKEKTAAAQAAKVAEAANTLAPVTLPDGTTTTPKVKATNPDGTPKLSPKAKASRGVDPNMISTWVAYDASPEENEKLQKVAKQRGLKVAALLLNILKEALPAYKEQFDADYEAYEKSQVGKPAAGTKKYEAMTEEQLEAEIAKQQKAIEKLREMANIKTAATKPAAE